MKKSPKISDLTPGTVFQLGHILRLTGDTENRIDWDHRGQRTVVYHACDKWAGSAVGWQSGLVSLSADQSIHHSEIYSAEKIEALL